MNDPDSGAESKPALEAAPFGRRLGALAVDCLLSAGVAALFTAPEAPKVMSVPVFFAAYTFFVGIFGQSPGMRLLHIACVREETGRPLGIPRAALRTALLQIVVPAVFLDARGLGWHDKAVGSIVVRSREKQPTRRPNPDKPAKLR